MRIAHIVGRSTVRGTPGRIAAYWGRYTEHEARAFAINRIGGWTVCDSINPYGFFCPKRRSKDVIRDWIKDCDVIHCHDDSYPSQIEGRFGVPVKEKTLVYQAHIGNIPRKYWARGGRQKFPWWKQVKHSAITNGYGHLFDEHTRSWNGQRIWGRLPDIIDIDHPTYRPDLSLKPGRHDKLLVVYTYSNHREGGKINAKRPKAHIRLVGNIKGIKFITVNGTSIEESMAAKKSAHIVLEECFTPYLHLSALEGAAVGACVVTQFNRATVKETSNAIGAPIEEWPFIYANEKTLVDVIKRLDKDREEVEKAGRRALLWARKYYSPERLLGKFLEFYGRKSA